MGSIIALEDVERLFDVCKQLRDERRKCAKLSDKARVADLGKPSRKASVDLNFAAVHVARLEAAVHAAAVDAGLADLREPEHYAERVAHPSGWHAYPWHPAKPRLLREQK